MLRLNRKHWWTLILALLLCSACLATQTGPARAGDPVLIQDGTPGPQNGDPDLPVPTKGSAGRGALQPSGGVTQVHTVGDGRILARVWIMRFHVMVRSFRSFYFRF